VKVLVVSYTNIPEALEKHKKGQNNCWDTSKMPKNITRKNYMS
jgi:hypothetical protein